MQMKWREKWKMNAAPDLTYRPSLEAGPWYSGCGCVTPWPSDPKLIELNLILYLFRFVLVSGSFPQLPYCQLWRARKFVCHANLDFIALLLRPRRNGVVERSVRLVICLFVLLMKLYCVWKGAERKLLWWIMRRIFEGINGSSLVAFSFESVYCTKVLKLFTKMLMSLGLINLLF